MGLCLFVLVIEGARVHFTVSIHGSCQLLHLLDVFLDSVKCFLLIINLFLGFYHLVSQTTNKLVRIKGCRFLPFEQVLVLGEAKTNFSQTLPPVCALLTVDELGDRDILHTELQVVHLGVVEHDFLILHQLSLDLLERASDFRVVHLQSVILFVLSLLLLELLHQLVLLVK